MRLQIISHPKIWLTGLGLKTFFTLFELKIWSGTFSGIALWTIEWAVSATVLTCGFGFILALALDNRNIRGKKGVAGHIYSPLCYSCIL